MSRHPAPGNRRTAIAAALMLALLGTLSSGARADGKSKSEPTPPVVEITKPVVKKSTEKIDDPTCPTGKHWVTYIYTDGELTDTKYGKCV